MAMVVVLSVFNGFTDLTMSRLGKLDPQVKIAAKQGKVIEHADSLCAVVEAMQEVSAALPTLEERALAVVDGRQMPIHIKGIDFERYHEVSSIDSTLIAGGGVDIELPTPECTVSVLSVGVASILQVYPGYDQVVDVYVPRRLGRINPANPAGAFRSARLVPAAVFRVDQAEYDNDLVYLPLSTARMILDYDTEATAIEATVADGTSETAAIEAISRAIGPNYTVENRLQQQSTSYKMIGVEKWITFMLLGFILVIASFNVISTLSMLIVEKEDNISTLRAMGASNGLIRKIFATQGWFISVAGGIIGAIIGIGLCLLQQHYGLVTLNGDPSTMSINIYPVKVEGSDLFVVTALVIVVGALTSMVATRIRR
jgi:ABC-type lipoprotein release transport system permease subunit